MMSLLSKFKEIVGNWVRDGSLTPETKQKMREFISEAILSLPEPSNVSEMKYADAIGYFVANRPDDQTIEKGAILRQDTGKGFRVVQVFLNKDNELVCTPEGRPYGRQVVVNRLDKELDKAFNNGELIIVE